MHPIGLTAATLSEPAWPCATSKKPHPTRTVFGALRLRRETPPLKSAGDIRHHEMDRVGIFARVAHDDVREVLRGRQGDGRQPVRARQQRRPRRHRGRRRPVGRPRTGQPHPPSRGGQARPRPRDRRSVARRAGRAGGTGGGDLRGVAPHHGGGAPGPGPAIAAGAARRRGPRRAGAGRGAPHAEADGGRPGEDRLREPARAPSGPRSRRRPPGLQRRRLHRPPGDPRWPPPGREDGLPGAVGAAPRVGPARPGGGLAPGPGVHPGLDG